MCVVAPEKGTDFWTSLCWLFYFIIVAIMKTQGPAPPLLVSLYLVIARKNSQRGKMHSWTACLVYIQLIGFIWKYWFWSMLKVRVKDAKCAADLRYPGVVICEHLKQIFSINKSINYIHILFIDWLQTSLYSFYIADSFKMYFKIHILMK